MKILKPLFAVAAVVLFCVAHAATEDESFQGVAVQRGAAVHPSQYSFADVYRFTVSGPALPGFSALPANQVPVRVAVTQAPAQFSVAAVPEPQLGLLLLSGFALALWVARRALGY